MRKASPEYYYYLCYIVFIIEEYVYLFIDVLTHMHAQKSKIYENYRLFVMFNVVDTSKIIRTCVIRPPKNYNYIYLGCRDFGNM